MKLNWIFSKERLSSLRLTEGRLSSVDVVVPSFPPLGGVAFLSFWVVLLFLLSPFSVVLLLSLLMGSGAFSTLPPAPSVAIPLSPSACGGSWPPVSPSVVVRPLPPPLDAFRALPPLLFGGGSPSNPFGRRIF